jgi:hypothetical protein
MTYRKLLEELNNLNDKQLDFEIFAYDDHFDTLVKIDSLDFAVEDCQPFVKDCPMLGIDPYWYLDDEDN